MNEVASTHPVKRRPSHDPCPSQTLRFLRLQVFIGLDFDAKNRDQISCFRILSVATELARDEALHASFHSCINDLDLFCEASSTEY
jgi:hypothetical protein